MTYIDIFLFYDIIYLKKGENIMENNKPIENEKENKRPFFATIIIGIGFLLVLFLWFFSDLPEKKFPIFFLEYWGQKLFGTILIVVLGYFFLKDFLILIKKEEKNYLN